MDKIRIGDIVRFSYNTTPRIYLIVKNRCDIGIMTQCVVEDITDGNAVIHAQSDENARLVIPTKYLIKVEAEAKEPKFKYQVGQKVKSAYADEILTIKEHLGRVGHDNVYRVGEYPYAWDESELKPYTEPKKSDDKKPHAIMIDKWEQYTADLAKEIVLKIAGSQLHNHKPQEIGRMAVEIAKSVVENLKEGEE